MFISIPPAFSQGWIWLRKHSHELKSMLGSVFFHPTCYKKQMQIEFALLRGCSRVVIKELYVEERIFLASFVLRILLPPETTRVWESEPAADALTVIISRAESCNHLDSFACSIYASIQDYFCTISVILSFLGGRGGKLSNSNTGTVSGGSVIGRIQEGGWCLWNTL